MKFFGVMMIIAGLTGAWGGPIDREYPQDWLMFLFALSLFVFGCWVMTL